MPDIKQHASDSAMTFIQKSFMWVASLNIGASAMAILEWIPRVAPAISLVFVIWVGLLTVREKKRSIREIDARMAKMESDRYDKEADV